MACNVQQYLPPDDSSVQEVEQIVHASLQAIQRTGRRRRAFLPPGQIELIVVAKDGHQLSLIGYQRKGGDFITELHHADTKLRALHTHEGHENPEPKRGPVDGCHMHFPTIKHPLVWGRASYAYALDCQVPSETIDYVRLFCMELDIVIIEAQPPLPRRGLV